MRNGYAGIAIIMAVCIAAMSIMSMLGLTVQLKYIVIMSALSGIFAFVLLILLCIAGDSTQSGRRDILRNWFGGKYVHPFVTGIWIPTTVVAVVGDLYVPAITGVLFAIMLEVLRKMNNNIFKVEE